MPTPCTNCLRFHYGECRESAKQCFECHGFNHIERYCPNKKNQIKRVAGEPLAGTKRWCEMHGLQHDPELKKRILNALKTNPGSAIYVNNICIYLGTEKHFDVEDMPSRGRTLEERVKRDQERSMSPPRYRRRSSPRYRDRSPPHDRGPHGYYSPPQHGGYRSRSPVRHRRWSPSPYHLPSYATDRQPDYRPRSPRYAQDSSAVVFDARERNRGVNDRAENRATQRVMSVKSNMPPTQPDFNQIPDLFHTPRGGPQRTAGNTNNIEHGGPLQSRDTNSQAMQGIIKESQAQFMKESQSQTQVQAFQAFKAAQSQMSPPLYSSQTGISNVVKDPHFVLGTTRGAGRAEIMDAYQQRMTEVEEERRADEGFQDRMPSHVWEESIGILIAAKRQLLASL
ncbi:hypothetical protein BKA65DRAFT_479721 [Rhexocercosporidium sp. MPI-PUGE-AT-0058]|nr:hypothetical protein BKA65DRAFT_479721 [Rhexocercosporidium sp. MPI-PUGE-AT-0058]